MSFAAQDHVAPDMAKTTLDAASKKLKAAEDAIKAVIFGQENVVESAMIALLCQGHALLVGVPGLAKTRLVETIGTAFGLDTKRVQFTPDLMPADILGSEILDENQEGKRAFRFLKGPVFCQLLMADEINRASPRTQSALLQAMQEGRVSIAGVYHPLPTPFLVLATQNPLEQEGAYPLPEAQLDRFLMQIDVGYPSAEAERRIILETTGTHMTQAKAALGAQDLRELQDLVRRLPIGDQVLDAILTLVREGRPEESRLDLVRRSVVWGPGPRAAQALSLAVRARALLQGRYAPSLADLQALAVPVLKHRMALGLAARAEGVTLEIMIASLLELACS